jgi:hypothetical protein
MTWLNDIQMIMDLELQVMIEWHANNNGPWPTCPDCLIHLTILSTCC